ncbi:NANOS3 [Lepeophtheirus salmonis]|uniref:NANOS3 n=1 Tax=Lepeophtheirus salmonis TaxID=72036 RepID=A0A7R8GZY5_LEPSM|nr:NANOS3 [Lepeophtheirus salmonis]CAF2773589.1 NANOS3 [Lepeophtheirus salmonis]
MELVNKIFSEPNLDNLQKDLRALDPHLKESLRMLESMTKSSSGCWSDNITKGSNLRGDAPVFMPSSYAAAVSKVPRMPSLESTPRFVVPIVRKTRPPFSNNNDKPIPDITANNLPRPPIRMTPATLKKFSTPEIVLPEALRIFYMPVLREYVCEVCKSTGDDAHIESNCPLNLIAKDNPTLVKLTLHNGLSEAKTR